MMVLGTVAYQFVHEIPFATLLVCNLGAHDSRLKTKPQRNSQSFIEDLVQRLAELSKIEFG